MKTMMSFAIGVLLTILTIMIWKCMPNHDSAVYSYCLLFGIGICLLFSTFDDL